MGIEFELKFRATPEILEKLQGEIGGEGSVIRMETTYYDTREGALSQRKITLRRRMENDISVCTLKTPAEALGRGEFEVLSDSIEKALPELCKLSGLEELPRLTQNGVHPVCGARFTRVAKLITLSDCTVELALDQGVLLGGGREIPLCEIEVELKSGSREGAVAYAIALAATYGLEREHSSKFRRALALAKGE